MNYSVCAILRMPHSCDGGGSLSEHFSSGEVFFFFFFSRARENVVFMNARREKLHAVLIKLRGRVGGGV